MSELVALSFDAESSPSITLQRLVGSRGRGDLPYGWGFAWYPGGELAAAVIKDPTSTGDDAMTHVLRDWERFRSTSFVCHLRGADKRITQRDAQPFVRDFAGRTWIFAHSGNLEGDWASAFPLAPQGPFEPLGGTDSEHLFAWMLTQLLECNARSLADLGPETLREWLLAMNGFGTANVLISDGEDIAIYHDQNRAGGLHWIRRVPPHAITRLASPELVLAFDNPRDPHRTMLVVSTRPLSEENWLPMQGGQLLVARRGSIVWDSHPAQPTTSPDETPTPGVAVAAQAQARATTEPRAETGESVLQVFHETVYRYAEPVERSSHRFRLRPVQDVRQEVLHFELYTSVDGLRREFEDVFGNQATNFEVPGPFRELIVRSESRVRVCAEDPLHLRSPVRRDTIPLVWMPWQRQMMLPYLLPPELPESELRELSEYAMSFVERNRYDLFETLLDINRTLYRDFAYVSGSTTLATTAFDVYASRRGVCQDFANLMICMARLLGVPARYRMGYIYTGTHYAGRVRSDASHAWVELYLPWIGWHGFDPTNDCQVNLDHVRVACGRNYVDATPTSGTLYKGGGVETLSATVRVERLEGAG